MASQQEKGVGTTQKERTVHAYCCGEFVYPHGLAVSRDGSAVFVSEEFGGDKALAWMLQMIDAPRVLAQQHKHARVWLRR